MVIGQSLLVPPECARMGRVSGEASLGGTFTLNLFGFFPLFHREPKYFPSPFPPLVSPTQKVSPEEEGNGIVINLYTSNICKSICYAPKSLTSLSSDPAE